jgi:beta-glucosidase
LAAGESTSVRFALPAADLGFFDVTRGRRCVETARHSILVGRSCTDIRLTAAFDVQGERIPPRAVLSTPLPATAFDDYCAVTLTDAAPDHGDATRSLETGAWLLFEDVDLADGAARCVAQVAAENTGGAIELRLDDPLHGPVLGSVEVPSTGHRHRWVQSATPLAEAVGLHALYVVFSGPALALRELRFER